MSKRKGRHEHREEPVESPAASAADELDPEVPPVREQAGGPLSDEHAAESAGTGIAAEESSQDQGELERRTQEAIEAQNKYLRTYADFENYRKRMQRDMADLKKFANEQMALDLLTVVDHLTMAVKHAAEGGEANQAIVQGVELVLKQLRGTLEKYGVKPFIAEGEPFNPAMHDAMMQVERDDIPENRVASVFQEGFLYHDKVLRHAKVVVSKRPAAAGPAGDAPAPADEAPETPASEVASEAETPEAGQHGG